MLSATLSQPYGLHPRQRIDVFVPVGAATALVCCIGGGWWADGRCEAARGFALMLAAHGLAVATLGHRPLGDGARTGDEVLSDLAEAAGKALEEAGVLGFEGRSMALLGHGSGALAALDLVPRLARRQLIRAVIGLGGLVTLESNHGTAVAHQAACDRFAMGRHRDLSPLYADPALLPALLLLHGDADHDVPLSQAQALQAHCLGAGETSTLEVLPGVGHGFAEDALARTAPDAAARIAAFLAEHAREPQVDDFAFGRKPS
jgi:acetyl esterase/lipase